MAAGDYLNYDGMSSSPMQAAVITTGDVSAVVAMTDIYSTNDPTLKTFTVSGQYGATQTQIDSLTLISLTAGESVFYGSIIELGSGYFAITMYFRDYTTPPTDYPEYIWYGTVHIDDGGNIGSLITSGTLFAADVTKEPSKLVRVGSTNFYAAISQGYVYVLEIAADGSSVSLADSWATATAHPRITPTWCAEGYLLYGDSYSNDNDITLYTVAINTSTGAITNGASGSLIIADVYPIPTSMVETHKLGNYYGFSYSLPLADSYNVVFRTITVGNDGTITTVGLLEHDMKYEAAQWSGATYVHSCVMGATATHHVIKEHGRSPSTQEATHHTILVDRSTGAVTERDGGDRYDPSGAYFTANETIVRLYTGGTDIGVYFVGNYVQAYINAYDETGIILGASYPTEDIRVSGLVHRYNRSEPRGYTLEIFLGGLESDFAMAESRIQAVSDTYDPNTIPFTPETWLYLEMLEGRPMEDIRNDMIRAQGGEVKPRRFVPRSAPPSSIPGLRVTPQGLQRTDFPTGYTDAARFKAELMREMEKMLESEIVSTQDKNTIRKELRKLQGE